MKKIAIITLNGYFNYGNRLQNYALTKILESLDFDVSTIWYKDIKTRIKDAMKSMLFFVKKYRRYGRFYRFSKKNMHEVLYKNLGKQQFDYFVVGSDQVWNYKFIYKDHSLYRPNKGETVISYAASMGAESIPEEYRSVFYDCLHQYKAISLREDNVKEYLENTLQRHDIKVHIDPTMLLDRSEWENIERKPFAYKCEKKYLLCYFLGGIPDDVKKIISSGAEKCGYTIIDLLNPHDRYYSSGPENFVFLIHHCNYVCTDSFHASVFSFLFDKPFTVFQRCGRSDYMYSRIQNFLKTFSLGDREYSGDIVFNEQHDYSAGYDILRAEKNRSFSYFASCLC